MNTIFAATLLASIASAAFASVTLPDRFEYAAKFVCGVESFQTAPAPSESVVNPGNYTTAVNIHNPWQFPVTVTKQIVISNPERFPDTRFEVPTTRAVERIPSGSSMYVDCTEIVNLLKSHGGGISGSFIEGFVVIDSFALTSSKVPTAEELDVVTVTTTAPFSAAGTVETGVNSHEIERVPGRHLPQGSWPE